MTVPWYTLSFNLQISWKMLMSAILKNVSCLSFLIADNIQEHANLDDSQERVPTFLCN
jgi:hypothetical protein